MEVGRSGRSMMMMSEGAGAALLIFAALTRARGGRAGRSSRIGRGCAEQTDRLEPAVRLLTDVADSF